SSCVPLMASNGSYTFTCSTPGDYNFNVPVCPVGVSVNCPTVPLKITVSNPSTPSSNSPIVNPDIASLLSGNTVTVKTLANDASGNPSAPLSPSTVTIVTTPKNGTASVNPLTGDITYTPNTGFVGSDTLTYKVCDTSVPAKCGTAQQIFTVLPTTSANTTVAVDDYNATPMNTAVSGNVKTNDSDPQGNTQTVTAGITNVSGVGSLDLKSDGSYVFTPTVGFVG
ncbi:Ig-like domain-containing protein, partial [Emticicia sp. W12TSBA100-4]|uniref:Ig-like domain-containing protein n=1 Tax=Emticicia sp. W12TSBA100-4 TaxID=3160965 RepID=UPI003305850E